MLEPQYLEWEYDVVSYSVNIHRLYNILLVCNLLSRISVFTTFSIKMKQSAM